MTILVPYVVTDDILLVELFKRVDAKGCSLDNKPSVDMNQRQYSVITVLLCIDLQ